MAAAVLYTSPSLEVSIYAERPFLFTSIGPLGAKAAGAAIVHPIEAEECSIDPQAIARIIAVTNGYPYFLQEWGKQCWNAAAACPITADGVKLAHPTALSALDDSFFRIRFDRLTPKKNVICGAWRIWGRGLSPQLRSLNIWAANPPLQPGTGVTNSKGQDLARL